MPVSLQRLREKAWRILGAAPLWVKIMGIVVLPLVLVIFVPAVFVRNKALEFLGRPEYRGLLDTLDPLVSWQFLLVLGSSLLLGFILAYGISRLLTRPMHNLLNVIGRVEQGDYSAKVDVWARDEIGRVQEAFNAMIDRLSTSHKMLVRRNRELTVIGDIAEALALRTGSEEVVEHALRNAMNLVDAEIGSLYRVSEDRSHFELLKVIGELPREMLEAIQTRSVLETPMRLVLESGKLIWLESIAGSDLLDPYMAELSARAGIKSFVSAPLKLQGNVIGVINLVRKTEKPFSGEDLALIEGLGSVIGIGAANIHLLEEVQEKEMDLRRALHRAVDLQEEERKRLARDLHDETGQALTSILIQLRALQDEDELETVHARLEGLRYLTAQTLEDLRRLAVDLRPAALDDLGILPALRWYSEKATERSGVQVSFSGPEKLERLPSEVEVALYRIAQEGVSNAIRHGKAQRVQMHLEQRPQALWMSVVDNGVGFDPENAGRGLGLIGIQERVAMLGGRFALESDQETGTRMWIELPLSEGNSNGH